MLASLLRPRESVGRTRCDLEQSSGEDEGDEYGEDGGRHQGGEDEEEGAGVEMETNRETVTAGDGSGEAARRVVARVSCEGGGEACACK